MTAQAFIQEAFKKLRYLLTAENGSIPFDQRGEARHAAAYLVLLIAEAAKTEPALAKRFGDEPQVLRNTVAHVMNYDYLHSPNVKRYLLESYLPDLSKALVQTSENTLAFSAVGNVRREPLYKRATLESNLKKGFAELSRVEPSEHWISQAAHAYHVLFLTESAIQLGEYSNTQSVGLQVTIAKKIRTSLAHPFQNKALKSLDACLQALSASNERTTAWLANLEKHLKGEAQLQSLLALPEKTEMATVTASATAINKRKINLAEERNDATCLLQLYSDALAHFDISAETIAGEYSHETALIRILEQKLTSIKQTLVFAHQMLKKTLEEIPSSESQPLDKAVSPLKRANISMVSALLRFIDTLALSNTFLNSYFVRFQRQLIIIERENSYGKNIENPLHYVSSPRQIALTTSVDLTLIKRFFPTTKEDDFLLKIVMGTFSSAESKGLDEDDIAAIQYLLDSGCDNTAIKAFFTPKYVLRRILSSSSVPLVELLMSHKKLKPAWTTRLENTETAAGQMIQFSLLLNIQSSKLPAATFRRLVLSSPYFDWTARTESYNDTPISMLMASHQTNPEVLSRQALIEWVDALLSEPSLNLFSVIDGKSELSNCIFCCSRHNDSHELLEKILQTALEKNSASLHQELNRPMASTHAFVGKNLMNIIKAMNSTYFTRTTPDGKLYLDDLFEKNKNKASLKDSDSNAEKFSKCWQQASLRKNPFRTSSPNPDGGHTLIDLCVGDYVALFKEIPLWMVNINRDTKAYRTLENVQFTPTPSPLDRLLEKYHAQSMPQKAPTGSTTMFNTDGAGSASTPPPSKRQQRIAKKR